VREGAEIDVKYSGYLARQQQQIERVQAQGQRPIPADTDFATITTLSREARERLNQQQPLTLGQASRLPGVSPADVTALLMWLEVNERRLGTPTLASNLHHR
jgi:tRNA uridine 5-carboxymethylaminomethyl modification enzyme